MTFLARNSRYMGTPLYQLNSLLGAKINSYAFGVWNRIVIPDRADDVLHYVAQHELMRLDLIANTYYSDSLLWWVIADKNSISDPLVDMYVGQELRIPTLESVTAAIEAAASNR